MIRVGRQQPSGRRQRKLPGKVGQWLERGPGALVDPGAGLGSQAGTVLDQLQRNIGLEIAGAQPLGSVLESRGQLRQGIGHVAEVNDQRPAGVPWTSAA